MKLLGLFFVLLLATLVPPPGHGAHRCPARTCPPLTPHLQPLRIVRSPQQPKLVRVVSGKMVR